VSNRTLHNSGLGDTGVPLIRQSLRSVVYSKSFRFRALVGAEYAARGPQQTELNVSAFTFAPSHGPSL
jgi:hypothetical protein